MMTTNTNYHTRALGEIKEAFARELGRNSELNKLAASRKASELTSFIAAKETLDSILILLSKTEEAEKLERTAPKMKRARVVISDTGTQERKKSGRARKRKEASVSRAVEMDKLKQEGKTLEEVGEMFGITKERVRQILRQFGFTTTTPNTSKLPLSEKLFSEEVSLKREAFFFGVTIAEYTNLRVVLGEPFLARIKKIFLVNDSNQRSGRVKHYTGEFLMQIGAPDLIEIYISEAKNRFPETSLRDGVRRLLEKKSGFMLTRRDHAKPATKENLHICTKQEFGTKFGKLYGTSGLLRKKKL